MLFGHYERLVDSNYAKKSEELTNSTLAKFIGAPAGGVKHRLNQLSAALGCVQVKCYPAQMEEIAEMQGGLSYRLHDAALRAVSLEDMISLASSKSYPTARLRRAILYGMTGVTAQDLTVSPAYLMLLAANSTGRELLRQWKTSAPIPVITKPADTPTESHKAIRQAALSSALDALFSLALPTPCRADTYIKRSPRVL
jgi:hypothetical protein